MALTDIYDLRSSSSLRNRITAACWSAGVDILNEADATPSHAERLALAKTVLADINGTGDDISQFFNCAICNATVLAAGEAATDNDLEFVVSTNWNEIAGA